MRPITLEPGPADTVIITASNTYPDRVYDVVRAPRLDGNPTWTPLGLSRAGNGGRLDFAVAGGTTTCFFRVIAILQ